MTTNDVMTAAEAAALAGVEHGGLCHEDAARGMRSVVALHEAAVERERAAWLAGAEAAREEAAETCDAWALLYHPTLRSTIATALAARIRALPPAAPPPPREGAVRAPDGGGTGEGSPDAPEGATGALAGEGRL